MNSRETRHRWATALRRMLAGCVLSLWAGAAYAAGPFTYIPNAGGNTVSVIDISSNTVSRLARHPSSSSCRACLNLRPALASVKIQQRFLYGLSGKGCHE